MPIIMNNRYEVLGTTADMATELQTPQDQVLDTISEINAAALEFYPDNPTPIITTMVGDGEMWFLVEVSFLRALQSAGPVI